MQAVDFVGDGEILVAKSEGQGKRTLHAPLILHVAFIFEIAIIADLWRADVLRGAVFVQVEIGVDGSETSQEEGELLIPFGGRDRVVQDIAWAFRTPLKLCRFPPSPTLTKLKSLIWVEVW